MLAHEGHALLGFLPNSGELSRPLKIDLKKAYGVGPFMLETILNGRGGELAGGVHLLR